MPSKINFLVYPVLIVLIFALLWIFTPLSEKPSSFIKLDGITTPYTIIFFGGLFAYLLWVQPNVSGISWPKLILVSAVAGHILSVASLTIAELLLSGGIERLLNSASTTGVAQFVAMQALFPALLGGWFFTILGTTCLKLAKKSAAKASLKH